MTRLDILSDPICPWCYIGKARLDKALSALPDHPFEIRWQPYQLNPDMPEQGMDRRDYLERKFAGKAGAVQIYSQIERAAQEDGLAVDFGAIKRTPNTLNAHRLIHWAGLEGRQNAIIDRLFAAYFVNGVDISQEDALLNIAKAAGMDDTVIKRLLQSDADRQEIIDKDQGFRQSGVTGVPCFIIGGHYVVQGAQSRDFWTEVVRDIVAQATRAPL